MPEVFKSWREGSVVKSWLLDLLDRALDEDPELANIKGYAEDTGEAGGPSRRASASRSR